MAPLPLIKFKFHDIHCLLAVFVLFPMVVFCQDEGARGFYLLEADILKKGKAIYSENPQVSEIIPLLERADQALNEGPYSVTFKKKPAPSGDIQDAMMNGNNHTTWYFAQTIPLALYLGRTAQADSLAKIGLPMILDKMIAKDGSQPHELSKTRSWDYSVMNLEAMLIFAKAVEQVGVGIREALDFLAAHLNPNKNWEYEQLGVPNYGRLQHSLYMAGLKFREDKYIQLANGLRAEKGPFDYFELVYSLLTTE